MTNLRSSVSEVKSLRPSESFRNLHLLRELVRRDFTMRFTGSAFGLTWAVLQPLTLVCLYWFVFTVMMPRSRAAGTDGYVNFLICGLLPWLGFQEGLMRGTTSIVENAAMVRRLTLKSELLVVVPNLSAILFELIGMALFLVFLVWDGTSIAGLWILPFALIMQLLLQIGLAWIAAVLFVFFSRCRPDPRLSPVSDFLSESDPLQRCGQVRKLLRLESDDPPSRFVPERDAGGGVT